ncbi:Squalene monooxygenase [Hypsizygus marmoreus]|uniref:Squalene monooxygenase n=1 Tax=Hypsizygus marmoreus TaxID=39966 RepID=A0A369JZ91_HYPMA|nr:Squalene monooxygenase [Hypsizygus marmoreus]
MWKTDYDVLIVGAGVVGASLAHALSTLPRSKPLRIALLERSLAEPDRIVGELLQPGGVNSLRQLGLESCLENIDAVPVKGYCVVDNGKSVHIPYPGTNEGRSFHHGKFITALRDAAKRAPGVEVIEATVTDLIQCEFEKRVIGVRATRKDNVTTGPDADKEAFFAHLVIIADGCFSNFRAFVMGEAGVKPETKSHFLGVVLENAELPIKYHGTVALTKGCGPVLLYQIAPNDTRMLVDVKAPLPADLKDHLLTKVVPQLPSALHIPIQNALEKDRIRRMPNSFLPPVEQGAPGTKEGVILIGDSWNMRHPLTGGGMTVAFNDVVLLRSLVGSVDDLANWEKVKEGLHRWHWKRKPLASTINILSVALYDLFGADDEELAVLRTGCFKYFERGGQCIEGPVSLLSGITPSPVLLFSHFFAVAFYSIWVMFTNPQPIRASTTGKPLYAAPSIDQYPALFLKSLRVFWTACVVFGPLLWTEIRWWAPTDKKRRNSVLVKASVPFLLAVLGTGVALSMRVV